MPDRRQSSAILRQFRHPLPEPRERTALRLTAVSFLGLAAYVVFESVRALLTGRGRIPRRSGSCSPPRRWSSWRCCPGRSAGPGGRSVHVLSAVLLVGLLLNATLGWSWADPVAGLVIAADP